MQEYEKLIRNFINSNENIFYIEVGKIHVSHITKFIHNNCNRVIVDSVKSPFLQEHSLFKIVIIER